MQMTEPLVTKAAARAARAQPAESRDRKYDKHLSYSATWGRLAGQAGSRGEMGGEKTRPQGAAFTLPAELSRQAFREGGGGAPAAETLSDAPVSGRTSGPQRRPNDRMGGGSSWSWGQKIPFACSGLSPTLEMGHQVKSTFGTGRNRVASFVAGRGRGADPAAGRLPWQSPRSWKANALAGDNSSAPFLPDATLPRLGTQHSGLP
ncbi:uncharacterized protein [Tursiops truncatus]|uniref:Uncharacterized protein LOC117307877 n=1 Tax=Tursiops truncatus TaxID=9739 RepID=A0A6J3PW84_TURTR|nr:uncharacterized protein LOC117307877 [Tursiops truncatus]